MRQRRQDETLWRADVDNLEKWQAFSYQKKVTALLIKAVEPDFYNHEL